MKQKSLKSQLITIRICVVTFILVIVSLFLFSFSIRQMAGDFLTQLGINKSSADEKITGSILGGSLDAYGLKNFKNIAKGDRGAVALDLLNYTKKFTTGADFLKNYTEMKNGHKPERPVMQTPDEMRSSLIAAYKKSIADTEESLKTADANLKPIFQNVLESAKKQLKEAEDPNNKQLANYAKNYDGMMKNIEASYQAQLVEWEKKYPTDARFYIKKRLDEFMNETKDIYFSAELTVKNGTAYFVNPAYERKSNRWKMAFRAGKEVVEPARKFVAAWITEIGTQQ